MSLDCSAGFDLFAHHVNPALHGFLDASGQNPKFVKAEGLLLYGLDGSVTEDWMAFWGSQNFGHNNSRIHQALINGLNQKIPSLYSDAVNPYSGLFAKKILDKVNSLINEQFYETVFFTNSGTEAVECSVKMSIAATKRRKILYCEGGYHGTTMGSLSMMAKSSFRDYLTPLLPEFISIPFNDQAALETALNTGSFAAFVTEPIQIESGVISADKEFIQLAQKLCNKNGTHLVIDEIQTGMYRTGTLGYFNQLNITPDIFLLGKSLAGGTLSAGACVTKKGIFQRAFSDYMTAELHFSTFAGSPLACVTGIEAFNIIDEPEFQLNLQNLANELKEQFKRIEQHPLVESVRLFGCMGAITVRETPSKFSWEQYGIEAGDAPTTGPYLAKKLVDKKIFTRLCAHHFNTLRVQPPLVINPEKCVHFADQVLAALDEIAGDKN